MSLLAFFIVVMSKPFSLSAQSWSLTGNSGTTSSNFLGTTDNKKLSIRTNNQNRMTITNGGKVGIGTTSPSQELHLIGTMQIDRSSINGNTTPALILNGIANNIVTVLKVDGVQKSSYGYDVSTDDFVIATDDVGLRPDFIINRTNGYTGLNNKTPFEQLHVVGKVRIDRDLTNPYFLQLNTTNLGNALIQFTEGGTQTADMGFDHSTSTLRFCATSTGTRPDLCILSSNGNVGLGTSSPASKLHLTDGDFEITNGGENFFLRTNASGQLDFVPNSGTTAAAVTIDDGNSGVGIHTSSPACELHVNHGVGSSTTFGVRIANSGANGNFWNFYTENSNAKLDLNANGVLRGTFDPTSGVYTAISDLRLKKDIENMGEVLPSLMKLEVKKYRFNENQSTDRKYMGLIAQDVMNVFPEVVYNNQCDDGQQIYTMDYSAFGVLAIKAIQELNNEVAEKDATISDLQKQIDDIKSALQACGLTCFSENEKSSVAKSEVKLFQNEPNPANQTTTIRFTIPSTSSDAQLIITDVNGKTIQQFNHLTFGQSQVEVSTLNLTSGTYQYSLYVDGRKVDTKQMIISK